MTSFYILSKLKFVARSEVDVQGLQLSSYSEQRIDRLIHIGIERMTINRVIEKQETINLAEGNIKRLIEYLAEQAVLLGSYPQMEDLAFDTAMTDCYPLWPYT